MPTIVGIQPAPSQTNKFAKPQTLQASKNQSKKLKHTIEHQDDPVSEIPLPEIVKSGGSPSEKSQHSKIVAKANLRPKGYFLSKESLRQSRNVDQILKEENSFVLKNNPELADKRSIEPVLTNKRSFVTKSP